jgi:hypothetical protein
MRRSPMHDPYLIKRQIRELLEFVPNRSDREIALFATVDEAMVAEIRAEEAAKEQKIQEWLAVRKEAARQIDPETAEVFWEHGNIADPYGVLRLPPEYECIGRCHFARAARSDIWVSFYHLTDATRERLWERIKSGQFQSDDNMPF